MTLNPGLLLGLASLFAFACVESPESQADCADCGDILTSEVDFGVDASEFDVAPPITTGMLRCPADSDLDLVLTTITLSDTLDLEGRNAGTLFRPEWAGQAQVEATQTASEHRFSAPVAMDGTYSLDQIQDGQGIGRLQIIPATGPRGAFAIELNERNDTPIELRIFPGTYEAMLVTAHLSVQDAVDSSSFLVACGHWTHEGEPCEWQESGPITIELSKVNHIPEQPIKTPVSGTLNFTNTNGQPLDEPCAANAGILFVDTNIENAFTWASVRDGSFETEVATGRYDIWIQNTFDSECFVGGMRLRRGVDINRDTVLNLTAPLIPLRGELLMNGARLPDNDLLGDEMTNRGTLIFSLLNFPDQFLGFGFPLGGAGPASLDVLALPGRYQVVLSTMHQVGRSGLQPMPQTVLPSTIKNIDVLTIQAPRTEYTADITVHAVQGSVRFNPDEIEPFQESGLSFLSANDNSTTWLPFDQGAYTFSGLLYEDSYQIMLSDRRPYSDHYPALTVLSTGSDESLWRIACTEPD